MTDNLANATDRQRINISEPADVRYWTQKLGIGADTLVSAVKAVGDEPDVVKQYLQQDPD